MATITIAAGQFKATCLKLLDTVATGQKSLVITKRGKPIARLVPFSVSVPSRIPLFGALAGNVLEENDIVSPLENDWAACQ